MKDISFYKSVFNTNDLPDDKLPEVVLCGRSNVGKSTFLNTLFNRKALAKVSSTPGKTRSLNFYLVEKKFYLVDLPGFGYAKVSKTERANWKKLVEDYFRLSSSIVHAFHLLDSRLEPTKLDLLLNKFLVDSKIPYDFILTKIDKIKQREIHKLKSSVVHSFPLGDPDSGVFLFSSIKGIGKKEVIKKLSELF